VEGIRPHVMDDVRHAGAPGPPRVRGCGLRGMRVDDVKLLVLEIADRAGSRPANPCPDGSADRAGQPRASGSLAGSSRRSVDRSLGRRRESQSASDRAALKISSIERCTPLKSGKPGCDRANHDGQLAVRRPWLSGCLARPSGGNGLPASSLHRAERCRWTIWSSEKLSLIRRRA